MAKGSMQALLANLDKGFYRDAKSQGRGPLRHLAVLAEERGLAPEGDEREGRQKKYLEEFRVPEMHWHGPRAERIRKFADDSWALSRAFAEIGLKIRGPEADTLEKVFAVGTSTSLFPVFVDSQVVAGILATSLVPSMVAEESSVTSHVVDHITMAETEAGRQTAKSAEAARATVLQVTTSDQSVKLNKYMASLDVTYEVLRLQQMNVVSIFLRRMGQQIGIDETDDAIQIAIAGDGNAGSAVVDTDAEVSGTLDYDELVRLALAFSVGYEFRVAITNATQLRTILNMAEFKDPMAGFNFQRTGTLPTPMGAAWNRWDSTGSAAFSTDRILALDNRIAMIQYTEGGLLTESDKLIDRQFEKTVVSKWTGFGKLDYAATKCLDIIP